MTRIKYKPLKTKRERMIDGFKRDLKDNPEIGLQPRLVRERLTGREKVDDKYWSIYKSNPFNETYKNSQYLEESMESRMRREAKLESERTTKEDIYKEFLDDEVKHKHSPTPDPCGKGCEICGALNNVNNIHCFNCGLINKL